MKKTCEFYSDNVRYTADILDVVPIPGDEYFASGEAVVSVEEIYPIVPVDRAMNGTAYRLETIGDGTRYERFCFVPNNERMTVEEFIQNLMDNDSENIQHMTVEQAENILSWTRGDDEDDVIPEGLTASELSRRWNEIRGNIDICTINLNEEEGRQTIYWNTEDHLLYTDYDDSEAYGVPFATIEEAQEAAHALWGTTPGWDLEWIEHDEI